MRVGSLFTGIGGFDLGLERAGHKILWQCEADPFRRAVLKRRWPRVKCYEDVRDIEDPEPVAILCGGFPCQDLSVAGRRAGLVGERSGLFFEFARVADALLPDGGWVLIENVPGLLSSQGGRDFAVLLATLAELGFHDLAWRVLDSRYLGVPQRRRRVFILARRAGGRRASEVLLEPESGGGDFEAGREARQRLAASLSKGSAASRGVSYPGRRREDDENTYVSGTVRSHARPGSNEVGSIVSTSAHPDRVREAPRLSRRMDVGAFHATQEPIHEPGGAPALGANAYLATDGQGEGTDRCVLNPKPDGPRYAACGDAVTVNVAEWIGLRLREYA